MEALKYKIKISILWISFAVATSASMIIWFIEPGILEQIMTTGEMLSEKLSAGKIIFFALWWIVPLCMAFLTQVLKHSLNCWMNLSLGILFALFTIYYFISHIITGWFTVANLIILIFLFIVSILIAWYGWKLPDETDQVIINN
jgi:hypothetical protein